MAASWLLMTVHFCGRCVESLGKSLGRLLCLNDEGEIVLSLTFFANGIG